MAHGFRRARDIDVGEWNYLGSHEGIPPLGNNAYSCPCSRCKTILSETSDWTKTQKESIKFDVRVGDRVLVHRNLPGIVKYVGDLDNRFTNGEIYVGVKLDDPVGEHDGLYDNKRFFRCPEMHGVMVPIEEIHIVRPFDGRNLISESPKKYFSMPELRGDVIRRRRFKSRSSNKVKAPSFVAPPPSRSGHLIAEKANEVTTSQCPSYTSKSNTRVEPLKSILRKNSTTTKPAKSVSFALPSSTEELECVAKAKSAGAKLCGKNSSKTTRQQSKSKDKSSLTAVNKARSAFATSDRIVTTSLKPARSEGSQQMSRSVTGPRLMPRRSRSSPIKLEALKPQDEMKSVPSLASITSEDMLMQQTSSTHCFADEKHSVRSSSTISVRCKSPLPPLQAPLVQRFSPLPPLPPLPAITDVHKTTQTVEAHLQPQPSYTNRLLSSLPPVGTTTPLSATTQLNDVKEFGDWVSTWGGGLKGWAMAQTLQKLKDAQRKGEKEVKWQRAIDELEKDPYFASQVQRIKTLRMKITEVRSQREETEKQLKEKKFSRSKVQKKIEKVQAEIKATVKESEVILHKINTHPLAAMVSGAKKLLFGNKN